MATISIALATFNGEKYLAQQLDSLAAQTRLPAELIICDDGSSDRTLDIVREFVSRAPFQVRIEPGTDTKGYRDNFMRAAALCTGDLIAFCDQDDVWEPDKLAVMEQAFDNPDALLAYHNATLISATGGMVGRVYPGGSRRRVYSALTWHPWLVVPGFMQMFRRELTAFNALHAASCDADWPGEKLAHDRWFFFLASVLGDIVYERRTLAHYRQHDDSAFGYFSDRLAHLHRLSRGETFIKSAAEAAANRAALLRQTQPSLKPEWQERARHGIAHYDRLAARLRERLALYQSATLKARGRAIYGLLRDGAYGLGAAQFGLLALLMDIYLALPFGPRLRRVFG